MRNCVRGSTGDGEGGQAPPSAGGLPTRDTGDGSASESNAPPPAGGLPPCDTGGGSASESKAPPPAGVLPPRHTGGGSARYRERKLRFFGRDADGAMLWKLRRGRVSRSESAEGSQRAAALPSFPRFASNQRMK